MSVPFLDLPPLRTPTRPPIMTPFTTGTTSATTATGTVTANTSIATGTNQPRSSSHRPPLGTITNYNHQNYTLPPISSNHSPKSLPPKHQQPASQDTTKTNNTPRHTHTVPVTPGGPGGPGGASTTGPPYVGIPFTPSPTYNIARTTPSNFTRTDSCLSVGSTYTMSTPISDDASDDIPVSPEQATRLAGIKAPARYPGALPESFTRQDPVPGESEDEDDAKKQKGSPSQNPWDYMKKTKKKERRRFTRRELEAIETLWWVEKSPNKYQRQRIGAWLGVRTKHITVWFQNKRQESKKHAKEQQVQAEAAPTPSSRAGRGSYDPGTGKWRPIPQWLISSAQPPAQDKCDAILAIANGELCRDEFLLPPPPHVALPRLPGRPVLGRNNSGSLDQILDERDNKRPRAVRRGTGDDLLQLEGRERQEKMLQLMSSSPQSSEVADDEDELTERRGSTGSEDLGGSPQPKRQRFSPVRFTHRDSFDRHQTHAVLAGPPTSSPSLSPPTPHYATSRGDSFASMMSFNSLKHEHRSTGSSRHPVMMQGTRVYSTEQPRHVERDRGSDSDSSLRKRPHSEMTRRYEDLDADVLQAAQSLFALSDVGVKPSGATA